jgi:hypothetical protein
MGGAIARAQDPAFGTEGEVGRGRFAQRPAASFRVDAQQGMCRGRQIEEGAASIGPMPGLGLQKGQS